MTRGKHASAAAARRVREEAVADAARLSKENDRLAAEVASLTDTVASLRAELAANVTAELTRTRERLAAATADARANYDLLRDTSRAITKTYEGIVRRLMKSGLPHSVAADHADAVTTFLIDGELLDASEVATDWGVDNGRLLKVYKRAPHQRGAKGAHIRRQERQEREASFRQVQGIG